MTKSPAPTAAPPRVRAQPASDVSPSLPPDIATALARILARAVVKAIREEDAVEADERERLVSRLGASEASS